MKKIATVALFLLLTAAAFARARGERIQIVYRTQGATWEMFVFGARACPAADVHIVWPKDSATQPLEIACAAK